MATDRKTVTFCSDLYTTTIASNTTTAVTMPTIVLPESGKFFRSVAVHVFWSDMVTATGSSYTVREVALGLGGGTKTTVTNSNTYTNSGENIFGYFCQDLTSRFMSDWSGTSMSCEIDVRFVMSGGTTLSVNNVSVMVEIDYEYDDTSPTQIKTIYYPLDTPNGAMATSKPASLHTIPALSTELPEASKVFRGKWIMVTGNTVNAGATTSATMSVELESGGAQTTASISGSLASDRSYALIFKPTWDETLTRTWHVWGSIARFNHSQAYAIVTYEFDASASNDVYHSLMLPMQIDSPIGANAEASRQYGERDLWIPELGTITTKRVAALFYWQQSVSLSTNLRIKAHPSDGWTQLTDGAAALCGHNAAQAITGSYFLARGRQTLRAECYTTTTVAAAAGGNLNVLWIVNYIAPKMPGGHGAHTKTRKALYRPLGTAAVISNAVVDAAKAPFVIPQANHFISASGLQMVVVPNALTGMSWFTAQFERLAGGLGEGGIGWESVYNDVGHPDAETGFNYLFAQMRSQFKRWPGDDFSGRLGLAISRRTRYMEPPTVAGSASTFWLHTHVLVTYHTHTWTVAGTVSGSAGGTVTLNLCRAATGEIVLTTSRVGDGAYSFTWYDNTEDMYVDAYEDATHLGRSATAKAA
jgi:hypothetical protein